MIKPPDTPLYGWTSLSITTGSRSALSSRWPTVLHAVGPVTENAARVLEIIGRPDAVASITTSSGGLSA